MRILMIMAVMLTHYTGENCHFEDIDDANDDDRYGDDDNDRDDDHDYDDDINH